MPLFIGIHGSSTCSLVNNGGHRLQLIQQWWLPIVNGWCQPFAAHAMATTQHHLMAQENLQPSKVELALPF
jgi:hypothetical protein